MDKVVTERGRAGGGDGDKGRARLYRVRIADADEYEQLDALPKHESLRFRHNRDRKTFTDVLGPLHGFLLKNAGRPWNKVMSEMARHLPKDSTTHIHVWSHVKQFVNEDVVVGEDGKLYVKKIGWRRYWQQPFLQPLDYTNTSVELFVDPRTGLLRKHKWYNRGGAWARYNREKRGEVLDVRRETKDPMVQLHKFKGIWYEVTLAPAPVLMERDPASHCAPAELFKVYGRKGVYGVKKRALNSKELRKLELVNDPADARAA